MPRELTDEEYEKLKTKEKLTEEDIDNILYTLETD